MADADISGGLNTLLMTGAVVTVLNSRPLKKVYGNSTERKSKGHGQKVKLEW